MPLAKCEKLSMFAGIIFILLGIALIIYSIIVINNTRHSEDNSNHTKTYILTSFGIIIGFVITIYGIILSMIVINNFKLFNPYC